MLTPGEELCRLAGWSCGDTRFWVETGMSYRNKVYVYHLTAVRNLPNISRHGLLSRSELRRRRIKYADVADPDILAQRQLHNLDEHVLFHFLPKNPFDYAVARSHPDENFALLAVRRDLAAGSNWEIIPEHPLTDSQPPDVLAWEDGLEAIDWSLMEPQGRDCSDRDCKLTCMAEALGPSQVGFCAVQRIYVPTRTTECLVANALGGGYSPPITVNPRMFPAGAQ